LPVPNDTCVRVVLFNENVYLLNIRCYVLSTKTIFWRKSTAKVFIY